ncbi:MAG: hypothetical protein K8S98_15415 [Planctomycetes bacterium]|nr:hypothetical protein [Planctomycetota bacterium]
MLPPTGPLRLADTVLIVVFLLALVAPLVDGWLRPSSERAMLAEQREPSAKPTLALSTESLTAFPKLFNAWYGDTFGLRDKLVRLHNLFKWFVLDVSPTPTLIKGKDDWVFFTWYRTIDVYRGVAPLTPKELEDWRRVIEYRRDWLARRGITYFFAVTPVSSEIYPEKMPERFDRVGPTRRDQLFEYMAKKSDVELVDFTPLLKEERKNDGGPDDFVYYRLGVHWTDRGILVGYRELMRRLQRRFPEMQPWTRSDFELVSACDSGDSWAWRLYMEDLLPQRPFDLAPLHDRRASFVLGGDVRGDKRRYEYVNEDASLPVCLLVGDSFAEPMNEFLGENFSRTYGYRRITFGADLIAEHEPDVVIQLYNERCFVSQDPVHLLALAQRDLGPIDGDSRAAKDDETTPDDRPYARFEAASDVRFALDAKNGSMLAARGAAKIERREEAAHASFAIETHGPDDGFELPHFDFPTAGSALLRMDVTCPCATTLELRYAPRDGAPDAEASRSRRILLSQGRNRLVFELDAPEAGGWWTLSPGRVEGRYVLHALEVRAVGN